MKPMLVKRIPEWVKRPNPLSLEGKGELLATLVEGAWVERLMR